MKELFFVSKEQLRKLLDEFDQQSAPVAGSVLRGFVFSLSANQYNIVSLRPDALYSTEENPLTDDSYIIVRNTKNIAETCPYPPGYPISLTNESDRK